MKAILCLLAVVCAVNADLLQKILGAEEGIEEQLKAAGFDVEMLKAELTGNFEAAKEEGLSDEEILAGAAKYIQHGCVVGFEPLPGKDELVAELERLCPFLMSLEEGVAAAEEALAGDGSGR